LAPDEVVFQTKLQIGLEPLHAARAAKIEAEVALLDADSGNNTNLRDGITDRPSRGRHPTSLWPPGVQPLPPKPWSGQGCPPSAVDPYASTSGASAEQPALSVPNRACRVAQREGTNTQLASSLAAVRVGPAHRDSQRATPRPEQWCLIEWPADEPEPTNTSCPHCPQLSVATPW